MSYYYSNAPDNRATEYNELYAATEQIRKERSRVRWITWDNDQPIEEQRPICEKCRMMTMIRIDNGKKLFCKNCLHEIDTSKPKRQPKKGLVAKHGSAAAFGSSSSQPGSIVTSKKKRSDDKKVSQVTDQTGLSDEDKEELRRAGIIR